MDEKYLRLLRKCMNSGIELFLHEKDGQKVLKQAVPCAIGQVHAAEDELVVIQEKERKVVRLSSLESATFRFE